MGKIVYEIVSNYDVGDVVVFEYSKHLIVGIVEGFYIDHSSDDSVWYNVRVNDETVFTYTDHGDIAEWEILEKLDGDIKDKCKEYILNTAESIKEKLSI